MEIRPFQTAPGTHRERFEKMYSSDPMHGWYYDGNERRRLVWLSAEEAEMTNPDLVRLVRALLVLES